MAGEIYIADKNTLDIVNTKVGTTNDTGGTSSAGSLMAKLNKNITDTASLANIVTSTRGGYIDNINTKVNTIASNDGRKGFTSADLITNSKFVMKSVAIPSTTTMTDILTLTNKSGYLYFAIASYSGDEYNNKTIEMTVTVDNIVICNKKITDPTSTGTTGLITPDSFIRSYGGAFYMAPTGNTNFSFTNTRYMEPPSSTQSTSDAMIYIPKPVRFTGNVKISARVYNGGSAQVCSYMYELD